MMEADVRKPANALSLSTARSEYSPRDLPDFDVDFILDSELKDFAEALAAPETKPVTALNDWKPINQKIKRRFRRQKKPPKRSKDETREGYVYTILHYPLLFLVLGWVVCLFIAYNITRLYIYLYEHFWTWTGRRENYRRKLHSSDTYQDWVEAAEELDVYLGNDKWKTQSDYAYYDAKTVKRVLSQLTELRERTSKEASGGSDGIGGTRAIEDLKSLLEACIKNNFVGVENPRLYSETYIGTKELVQEFVNEVEQSLKVILNSDQITEKDKETFFKHLELNYGRTALCLSGGATFAYYHFGVVKALLDTGNLPEIITGTSGGALIAALVATRTDDELKQLLVPSLAYRIRACQDGISTWAVRWWKTGARFDSIDWARQCAWFCRGSLTFREAFERTGRILNVSCVPSDPHSPALLLNHLTSPECVVWSAVLASAAVPGILNPVVLLRKTRDGSLAPYSFGNKWKDGSLRTDIPLKALNLHFNVNFSIVSQVNPHVNLFFFSPRGSPGRPVTHRRGRGWRGGFLGSTLETSIKLDLQKYLKILRHLELLPRPLGQDWSEIWLQRFSGTITIWPKSILSDFWNILSDPSPARLRRMLSAGQKSCWPKIRFIANRMKVERVITEGLRQVASPQQAAQSPPAYAQEQQEGEARLRSGKKWRIEARDPDNGDRLEDRGLSQGRRHSSMLQELTRQASVLWDDELPTDGEGTTDEEAEESLEEALAE
jgi:predicted acylesterase/phospholipase RssA